MSSANTLTGDGSSGNQSVGRRVSKWWDREGIWYAFLIPSFLLLVFFLAYPLGDSLVLSFFQWKGLGPRRFVGLDNFVEMIHDRLFWGATWQTMAFAVLVTLGTVGIGFLLAVAISRRVTGWRTFRVGYYLPVMLSLVVVGALWLRIYEYNWGLLNTFLRSIGLDALALPWIADKRYALWSLIVVPIWQYAGFPMIVILAAMEGIPQDLHDAGTMDGVNEWQRARHLTFPLIRPVVASISVMQLIFSLKVFDLVWVMTKGDPGNSTAVLGTFLFRKGFETQKYGYASAVAVVMFIIVFTLTYLYQHFVKIETVEF
jgi:raffinose/stachyose/melibiose transport system permease protein